VTIDVPLSSTPTPSNDLLVNASFVDITSNGGTRTMPAVDVTGFGVEAGEEGAGPGSAWWIYHPTSTGSGVVDIDCELSTTAAHELINTAEDGYVSVWTGGPAVADLVFLADFEGFGDGVNLARIEDLPITSGTTYFIRGSFLNENGKYFVLRVHGPRTVEFG
jgi:hypothetical protein